MANASTVDLKAKANAAANLLRMMIGNFSAPGQNGNSSDTLSAVQQEKDRLATLGVGIVVNSEGSVGELATVEDAFRALNIEASKERESIDLQTIAEDATTLVSALVLAQVGSTTRAAVDDIQKTIDSLIALQQQGNVDASEIFDKIDALQQSQQDIKDAALKKIEETNEIGKDLTNINAAAKSLSTEAAVEIIIAGDLAKVSRVLNCATSFLTALEQL